MSPYEGDLYQEEVDFRALAERFPEFAALLNSKGQLDFTDPKAVQQLTKSLLKRDFGLEINLPDDRLCPPVPNRYLYIRWLHELLDSTSSDFQDEPCEDAIGLDIGTGSSCIYPLIGCSLRKWRFIATDIDEKNLSYAKQNVVENGFEKRIKVVSSTGTPLIPLQSLGLEKLDFVMCNPPFYSSTTELEESAKAKSRPPNSACTGAVVEMVTGGGEVAFVQKMLEESVDLGQNIRWFSSMLGKFSSVGELVSTLKDQGVHNWAVREFVQGQKTRRWALAWSWGDIRPPPGVARSAGNTPKHMLPFPTLFSLEAGKDAESQLGKILRDLDLKWRYDPDEKVGIGYAARNVWSRSGRRASKGQTEGAARPALVFQISLESQSKGCKVCVRWLVGTDSVLFESFCGMLKRQLAEK